MRDGKRDEQVAWGRARNHWNHVARKGIEHESDENIFYVGFENRNKSKSLVQERDESTFDTMKRLGYLDVWF